MVVTMQRAPPVLCSGAGATSHIVACQKDSSSARGAGARYMGADNRPASCPPLLHVAGCAACMTSSRQLPRRSTAEKKRVSRARERK